MGIGTNTPTALLELNKTEGSISLSVKRGTNSVANIGSGSSGTGEHGILQLFHNNVENIRLYTTGDSWINGGNLGVGTATPAYKLEVNGTIHAKEVKIDLNFPADYVFKFDYRLMSLAEVEQFIKANSHLPEIPSATEIKENGLNIGDMQNKLLQKIEELTLYTIEQNKKLEQQNEKITALENEIKEMKKK